MDEEAERTGQGHDALIPEAQRSGSLALPYVGQVDALEERRADGTALAGTFDHKQAVVDGARFLLQLGQMGKPALDVDVRRVIDDRLDADRLAFLEVLLDTASEDKSDLVGTADADIVGDQGLEEGPRPAGVVEDDGAGDLDLRMDSSHQ